MESIKVSKVHIDLAKQTVIDVVDRGDMIVIGDFIGKPLLDRGNTLYIFDENIVYVCRK